MTEKELFLYELSGHGYEFKNTTFTNDRFEDDSLNMAWEMWKASAKREGFVLVPKKCTNNMAHAAKSIDGRLSVFKYSYVWGAMLSAVEGKD